MAGPHQQGEGKRAPRAARGLARRRAAGWPTHAERGLRRLGAAHIRDYAAAIAEAVVDAYGQSVPRTDAVDDTWDLLQPDPTNPVHEFTFIGDPTPIDVLLGVIDTADVERDKLGPKAIERWGEAVDEHLTDAMAGFGDLFTEEDVAEAQGKAKVTVANVPAVGPGVSLLNEEAIKPGDLLNGETIGVPHPLSFLPRELTERAGQGMAEIGGEPGSGTDKILTLWSHNAADKIVVIEDRHRSNVAKAVVAAFESGLPPKRLAAKLAAMGVASERRAMVWARHQIGLLNSGLTRLKHEKLGITHYIWRTSLDERVRHTHAAREGRLFSYARRPDTDPIDGHPGEPIQCRCTAEAVMPEELTEASEAHPSGYDLEDEVDDLADPDVELPNVQGYFPQLDKAKAAHKRAQERLDELHGLKRYIEAMALQSSLKEGEAAEWGRGLEGATESSRSNQESIAAMTLLSLIEGEAQLGPGGVGWLPGDPQVFPGERWRTVESALNEARTVGLPPFDKSAPFGLGDLFFSGFDRSMRLPASIDEVASRLTHTRPGFELALLREKYPALVPWLAPDADPMDPNPQHGAGYFDKRQTEISATIREALTAMSDDELRAFMSDLQAAHERRRDAWVTLTAELEVANTEVGKEASSILGSMQDLEAAVFTAEHAARTLVDEVVVNNNDTMADMIGSWMARKSLYNSVEHYLYTRGDGSNDYGTRELENDQDLVRSAMIVTRLDELMDDHGFKLERNIVIPYRTFLRQSYPAWDTARIGSEIEMPAYVRGSILGDGTNDGEAMRVEVPAGTRVLMMRTDDTRDARPDAELLLPRNGRLVYIRDEPVPGSDYPRQVWRFIENEETPLQRAMNSPPTVAKLYDRIHDDAWLALDPTERRGWFEEAYGHTFDDPNEVGSISVNAPNLSKLYLDFAATDPVENVLGWWESDTFHIPRDYAFDAGLEEHDISVAMREAFAREDGIVTVEHVQGFLHEIGDYDTAPDEIMTDLLDGEQLLVRVSDDDDDRGRLTEEARRALFSVDRRVHLAHNPTHLESVAMGLRRQRRVGEPGPGELQGFREYTGASYADINAELRAGVAAEDIEDTRLRTLATSARGLIERGRTERMIGTHRGVTGTHHPLLAAVNQIDVAAMQERAVSDYVAGLEAAGEPLLPPTGGALAIAMHSLQPETVRVLTRDLDDRATMDALLALPDEQIAAAMLYGGPETDRDGVIKVWSGILANAREGKAGSRDVLRDAIKDNLPRVRDVLADKVDLDGMVNVEVRRMMRIESRLNATTRLGGVADLTEEQRSKLAAFTDDGLVSSSRSPKFAIQFAGRSDNNQAHQLVMQTVIPEGQPAAYTDDVLKIRHNREQEYVHGPGAVYYVRDVDVRVKPGNTINIVATVEQGPRPANFNSDLTGLPTVTDVDNWLSAKDLAEVPFAQLASSTGKVHLGANMKISGPAGSAKAFAKDPLSMMKLSEWDLTTPQHDHTTGLDYAMMLPPSELLMTATLNEQTIAQFVEETDITEQELLDIVAKHGDKVAFAIDMSDAEATASSLAGMKTHDWQQAMHELQGYELDELIEDLPHGWWHLASVIKGNKT